MNSTSLNRLSAVEAAQLLAHRDISAEALVRACLDRIAEREPVVHAFQHLDADGALAAARRLDAGPVRGLLHGLPIGVKDLFDTHDMPSTFGSPIYAGHRAAWDAAAVALSRDAGAVVVGKTVTTEFAAFTPGPTRNPHNPDHTPGGSSSGTAAAVADFMLPLAIGTQTAASVVRPSAYCGVVGFKPSFGRVPRNGIKMFSESLDTVGAFGRSVADAALLAAVLMGDANLVLSSEDAPASLRVALFQGPHWALVDDDIRALWSRIASRLSALAPGSSALAVPAWFEPLAQLQTDLMLHEAALGLSYERISHADQLSPRLRAMLQQGIDIGGTQHAINLVATKQARRHGNSLFEHHDVLIAPSAMGEAGLFSEGTGDPICSRAWMLLGMPSLHLPLGTGKKGLPIGLQLVAPVGEDARLLQAGAWLHQRLVG